MLVPEERGPNDAVAQSSAMVSRSASNTPHQSVETLTGLSLSIRNEALQRSLPIEPWHQNSSAAIHGIPDWQDLEGTIIVTNVGQFSSPVNLIKVRLVGDSHRVQQLVYCIVNGGP
ncbi:hypothetical protein MHU86_5012 [Fragilaria crotonensis]|nr:hypothetical protein MHU86_5012 [Fragilaria crotonensis]